MSEAQGNASSVRCLAVLVAIATLLFLIRAPFTASFWLDETITAWVVSGSLHSAWTRAVDFQGQSPLYYSLVWVVRQFFGEEEVVLRGLSIVCGGLALVVTAHIARKLSADRALPLIVVALLIGSDGFQDAVLSARPYALAMLCASTSLFVLLSLREGYAPQKAAALSASLVATFYAHYLFIVIGLVHALVVLRDRQLVRRLVPWGMLTVIAFVPGIFQLLSLSHRAAALSFAPVPVISVESLSELPAACFAWTCAVLPVMVPLVAVVSCIVALVLAVIWDGRIRLGSAVRAHIRVLLPYILIPPPLFLVISYLSPGTLFVARYWSWSLVPLALFLGLLVCSVAGERARRIALVTTVMFVILRVLSQERVLEEWRGAAEQARASGNRVVLFSGLIEAEGEPLVGVGEYSQYLRAPLLVYGVRQPIDVVGVTYSQDKLARAFEATPFTLIALHACRSGMLSPERFLDSLERQGRTLVPEKQGRLITVANVR